MSEKYNKEDFYNNAPINTRVRNSETGIFYIKTKKGWQKDDSGASRIGRLWESDAEEDAFYSGTIGKDGRFYLGKGRGFTITNDHPLAEKFRADEQGRVQLRIDAPAKKAEKQKLSKYNALKKHIDEQIKFYQGQEAYKDLNMSEVFKKAYNSGDPAKYLLKNHNIRIGQAKFDDAFTTHSGIENLPMFKGMKGGPTGMVGRYFFDSYGSLMDLEKELNINQPEEIESSGDAHTLKDVLKINNTGNGTNGEKVNTNKNQQLSINQNFNINNEVGKIVSSDTNLKGLLNNGKEKTNNNNNFENRITSNGKNKSNNNNNNNTLKDSRFSWEKDLNTKQAKELQNIRKVFGDYRKELNISKRIAGSNTNRRRLTGPMDQHTAEMLGLA